MLPIARNSGLGTRDSERVAISDRVADLGSRTPVPESRIPSPASTLTVECIDDAVSFSGLGPRWNELLRASACDNPFLTFEWLQAWWVHLGENAPLRLIVVRSDEALIAIAPLRLVSGTVQWFSTLEFLGTGHAGSDYLDLIVRRGHEEQGLAAIADYLKANQIAIRLNHLPPSSLGARLAELVAADGWASSVAADGTCPVIPLAGLTLDGYLATRGASHRANFRRRLRALQQRFGMRFDRVTGDAERGEMLTALIAFHERRWKEEGGSSAFATPEVCAFQEEASRRALAAGWLRMYVLRLNGEVAAVMYGFNYNGRFYFYQHGFDDRYQAHSVGLVLMGLTIRAAIEEGAAEFDMLWGVEPYKFLWATETRTLQRLELFPIHFGGTIHRHALEARRSVKSLARRVLAIGESLGS